MTEKCFYCDAPAVRYCDFNIGGPIGSYTRIGSVSRNEWYACFDVDQMPYRCDMPLCEAHAKKVGNVFMKGNNDTIDHCPEHVGCDESKCEPCTEAEATAIRGGIRANARRRLMRLANSVSAKENI